MVKQAPQRTPLGIRLTWGILGATVLVATGIAAGATTPEALGFGAAPGFVLGMFWREILFDPGIIDFLRPW